MQKSPSDVKEDLTYYGLTHEEVSREAGIPQKCLKGFLSGFDKLSDAQFHLVNRAIGRACEAQEGDLS